MPNLGSTRAWTFLVLHRILHNRKADWPTTAVQHSEILPFRYLWEDVRTAEKLDTIRNKYAIRLECISLAQKIGK
jgi:hypothetical protein